MDERRVGAATVREARAEGDSSRPDVDALLDYQSGCWGRGERPSVESCLDRRPGLRESADAALDLICHEILLRVRFGEAPGVEEYVRRYPRFADQLRAHFEVHEAMMGLAGREDSTVRWRPTVAATAPPVVAGYEILGEVGSGAMGVVYKARRVGLNRLTALKMLRPSAAGPREAARFRAEAEALARLEHPNIVRIYEVGEYEGRPYFALELVTGGSLEAKLRGAPQPARRAAELVETLARAVHAAHERGVVHRDLKPANVLLTPDGAPKITDFGLAKRLDADAAQTRTGDILGTPSYMAPEQARGRNDAVGPPADVYALGAILYELLTGRPPFQGETVWDTLEQVVHREPTPPRQLAPRAPRDLETICLKCLNKEPARRYRGAADLADDLRRLLSGEPIRARPTPAWERAWKWVRRRPAVSTAVVVAVLSAALLGAAHYADLRAKVAQAERDAAASDVKEHLAGVRLDLDASRWQQAEDQLRDGAMARLRRDLAKFPADDALHKLAAEAEELQQQIDRRLTDEERLRRFRQCRREAGFQATPFGGLDAGERGRRTREAVETALRLFDGGPGSGDGPALDSPYFTDKEKSEVLEGYCELLLELADAEPADADGALDRAARLGVDTPLIAYRRARGRGVPPPAPLTRAFEWFLRGVDLCVEGRPAEAIDHFEKALALQPDHFGAHYALAVCYLKVRDERSDSRKAHLLLAREHLNACVREEPGRVWPYLQRALAHGELKDFAAAEADFAAAERLLQDAPDQTARYALLVNRGVNRIHKGDPEGAVADLTLAVGQKPDESPAYLDLAKAYQDQHRLREAGEQLDRALVHTASAGLAAVYRNRARLDQQQNDLNAAVRDLEQALRREPDGKQSPEAAADYLLTARLLMQGGKHEEAVRAADASLAIAPDDPAAHRLRAEALLRLDRFAEAVQALDRHVEAVRRGGRSPEAAVYRARAQANAAVQDYAAAAEDYTHYLELEPGDAAGYSSRGWSYVALESPTLALRDFETAVRLNPNDGDAYNGRGYALARSGRPAEAVRDAEHALRLEPHQSRTLYNAARVFARAGEGEGDEDARERALRLRRLDKALQLLREALEALPEDQRSPFWERNVERDAALKPVRTSPEFSRLAEAYAKPPAKAGASD